MKKKDTQELSLETTKTLLNVKYEGDPLSNDVTSIFERLSYLHKELEKTRKQAYEHLNNPYIKASLSVLREEYPDLKGPLQFHLDSQGKLCIQNTQAEVKTFLKDEKETIFSTPIPNEKMVSSEENLPEGILVEKPLTPQEEMPMSSKEPTPEQTSQKIEEDTKNQQPQKETTESKKKLPKIKELRERAAKLGLDVSDLGAKRKEVLAVIEAYENEGIILEGVSKIETKPSPRMKTGDPVDIHLTNVSQWEVEKKSSDEKQEPEDKEKSLTEESGENLGVEERTISVDSILEEMPNESVERVSEESVEKVNLTPSSIEMSSLKEVTLTDVIEDSKSEFNLDNLLEEDEEEKDSDFDLDTIVNYHDDDDDEDPDLGYVEEEKKNQEQKKSESIVIDDDDLGDLFD